MILKVVIYYNIYSVSILTSFRSDDPASAMPSVRDLYLGVYGALGGFSALTIMTSSLLVAVGGLNASR